MKPSAEAVYPRPVLGLVVGLVGVGTVAGVLAPFHADLNGATPALVLVLPVLVAAVVGGRRPALVVAVVAAAVLSVAFLPPVGSLRIHVREDTVAFVVFAAVAATVVPAIMKRRDPASRTYLPHVIATLVALALIVMGIMAIGRSPLGMTGG
jgi:two-component system, OmpR family, sensor histidine kinase KdpD